MNREQLIAKYKAPFCPALMTDAEFEDLQEFASVATHSFQVLCHIGWKVAEVAFTGGDGKKSYYELYRLDPSYTEAPDKGWTDYDIKIGESGRMYYEVNGVDLSVRGIPETKLGGYIYASGDIRINSPIIYRRKDQKYQNCYILSSGLYSEYEIEYATKVRILK